MILLARYVARTVFGAIAMVMAVLIVLGVLFNFIGEQGAIGVGRYDMVEGLVYSLLTVPRFALTVFPVGVLMGSMLGIGALARSHELTAMRSSGMSKWRLAVTMLACGVVLLIIGLAVGEYIAPRFEQLADERKALARYENLSLAGAGGAWVRDGNLIINIAERSSISEFGGMLVFELTPDNRLAAVAKAHRATQGAGTTWNLGDYFESRFDGDTVQGTHEARHSLTSAASVGFLKLAVVEPSEMALGLAVSGDPVFAYQRPGRSGLSTGVLVGLGTQCVDPDRGTVCVAVRFWRHALGWQRRSQHARTWRRTAVLLDAAYD